MPVTRRGMRGINWWYKLQSRFSEKKEGEESGYNHGKTGVHLSHLQANGRGSPKKLKWLCGETRFLGVSEFLLEQDSRIEFTRVYKEEVKDRVTVCRSITKAHLIFCNPLSCSPPGSSVQDLSQERMLEWDAISLSRWSSWPRDRNCHSCHISTVVVGFSTFEPWVILLMTDLELQRVQWKNLGIGEERSIYHVQSCMQTPGGYLGEKEWPRAIGCLIVSDGNEDQDGLQDTGDESMNVVASRVCGFSWCSQNSRTLFSPLPVVYGNQGRKGVNRNNKT